MGSVNTHTDLWLESGCLSREGIRLYLSGTGSKEQQRQIEKHLENCSFCREAVEGYQQHPQAWVQTDRLHAQMWERLRKGKKGSRKALWWTLPSAAALLLLLFTVFTADFFQKQRNPLAVQTTERILTPEIEYLIHSPEEIALPAADIPKQEKEQAIAKEEASAPEAANRKKTSAAAPAMRASKAAPRRMQKAVAAEAKPVEEIRLPVESAKIQAEAIVAEKVESTDTVFYSKPVFLRKGNIPRLHSKPEEESAKVFMLVTDLPQYSDSLGRDFETFLKKKAHIPLYTSYAGESETVYLDFCISSSGKLEDIRLIQGSNPMLNMEAIRLVSLSGTWEPASYQGRKVDSRYFMPVRFRATDQASSSRLTGQ